GKEREHQMARRVSIFILVILLLAFAQLQDTVSSAQQANKSGLLDPVPVQPVGDYDAFGSLLTPAQAGQLVVDNGLNPLNPDSYRRLGLVHITPELIARGQSIFFEHKIGDSFGLQKVFGFAEGFARILPEVTQAIKALNGKSTTDLQLVLLHDLTIGSR